MALRKSDELKTFGLSVTASISPARVGNNLPPALETEVNAIEVLPLHSKTSNVINVLQSNLTVNRRIRARLSWREEVFVTFTIRNYACT